MSLKTETRQMYAVVCERLHVSFAPFRTEREAARYAAGMDEYSRRNMIEKGGDPDEACRYAVVTMWIQVIDETPEGVVEYDRDSKKEKMN